MSGIYERLNEELDRLLYEKEVEKGNYLTKDDIDLIFETLKKSDKELEPLFENFKILVDQLIDQDNYLVRNTICNLLEYYNILENPNVMKSRHKFYFSESKKLIKKPYFSPTALENIKNTFKEHRIFKKLQK